VNSIADRICHGCRRQADFAARFGAEGNRFLDPVVGGARLSRWSRYEAMKTGRCVRALKLADNYPISV
jgi:hypothetical protein